jgi:hypothetical protein
VEFSMRKDREKQLVGVDDALQRVIDEVRAAKQ